MKHSKPSLSTTPVSALALLTIAISPALALAQPGQGRGAFALDPRAEDRTYHFADTNEDMQYCVFVSSKISADTPAPLIITLHGLGATPQIMCNKTAVDLAEAGGYILASPMGYNTGGWYGSPVLTGGPAPPELDFDAIDQGRDGELKVEEVTAFFGNLGNGPGPNGPGGADFAARAFERWDANGDGSVTRQEFVDRPRPGAFGGGNQPENLAELSEKDVMNVLAMMRKEFNVDSDRIYLTGHSMGGAGTLFLGSKHAEIFAAIAPVAPAAFSMTENRAEILGRLDDAGVPVMIIHGDADEAVPVDLARTWVATMKEIGMEHEYVELPGVTHGPVITISQERVYAFFDKHAKR